jgi:hypothetical protein
MTTIVGLPRLGWVAIWWAYSSISIDLPEPWVCQTTPALPLLRVALMVSRTAWSTTKYWCGLAIRLTGPVFSSANET